MKPPPGTLLLEAASPAVAALFEQAFSPNGVKARPTPQDWITALERLAHSLTRCRRHSGHFYFQTLIACPWCDIEARSGIVLFPVAPIPSPQPHNAFNLAKVWSQIEAVSSPGPLPQLPDLSRVQRPPSAKAIQMSREFRRGLGFVTTHLGVHSERKKAMEGLNKTLREAERQWQQLEQKWRAEATDADFHKKRRELESKKSQYLDLPGLKQRRLNELQTNLRQAQLHRFLDKYHLTSFDITGIGPARKATLQSYGIETAADVVEQAILNIPGFGPSLTGNLLRWRRSFERRFVFDPNRGVDPADIRSIERDIAVKGAQLEQELLNGAAQLQRVAQEIKRRREALLQTAARFSQTIAQAKADLQIL